MLHVVVLEFKEALVIHRALDKESDWQCAVWVLPESLVVELQVHEEVLLAAKFIRSLQLVV